MKLLLIVICLICTAYACGQRTPTDITGTPTTIFDGAQWEEFPVRYCIVTETQGFVSTSRFVELVQKAFETWGKEMDYTGDCGRPILPNDFRNEVGWGTLEAGTSGHPTGLTRVLFRPCNICVRENTLIQEADITIEMNPPDSVKSEACLYSVILHETGHFLGLQHSDSVDAVMGPWLTGCPQDPAPSDRAALKAIYGEE